MKWDWKKWPWTGASPPKAQDGMVDYEIMGLHMVFPEDVVKTFPGDMNILDMAANFVRAGMMKIEGNKLVAETPEGKLAGMSITADGARRLTDEEVAADMKTRIN